VRTDVEFLRIISALGIVWFHSGLDIGRDMAYSGLVVFLIFTSYFAVKSTKEHSVLSRAARFLIPCVLWSILYASLNLVRGGEIIPDHFNVFSKILATPSIHLWYLPFAFICVLALDKIKNYNPKMVAVVAALFFTILLASAPIWRQWPYISPLGQYMHALPAVFIGITFSLYGQLENTIKRVVDMLILLTLSTIIYFNLPGISETYTVGVLASLILLRKNSFLSKNTIIIKLSQLTFGVYLIHPLFLFALTHFGIISIMLPMFAFSLSMLSIFIMFKVLPKSVSQHIA
jgi:hypothetical protein